MKPCTCTPRVEAPAVRAWLTTGGVCLYNPGRDEAEALRNLRQHARADRVRRGAWVECWIERIDGSFVRDVPLDELAEVGR